MISARFWLVEPRKYCQLGKGGGEGREEGRVSYLVIWCFEPCQPLEIISGLKETFINRSIAGRTNKAEIRRKEQSEGEEECEGEEDAEEESVSFLEMFHETSLAMLAAKCSRAQVPRLHPESVYACGPKRS